MSEVDAVRFRDFEHAGWQRAAPAYERHWVALTAQALRPLLDRTGVGPGVRLLDVACGTGQGVLAARGLGADVVGVDFSAAMLAVARRTVPETRFEEADVETLPFSDDSFDVAICNFGLLHFARPEAALREIARVLRPGGRLGATVWARPEPGRHAGCGCQLVGIIRAAVAEAATAPDAAPPAPDFFQYGDPDRFREALTDAGLTDLLTESLPLVQRLPDAETLWQMTTEGTVRTAALLRAQPPETTAAIRRLVEQDIEAYRDPAGSGYVLPAEAVLAVGRKAGTGKVTR